MVLTKNDLVEMMAVLDKDGDGEVSKDEFKIWMEREMKIEGVEFEKLWVKIDQDGDGSLQQSELCAYFGISFDEADADLQKKLDMSDEEILQALQMQSLLAEQKETALKAEEEKKKKALTKRSGTGARVGIKVIKNNEDSPEGKMLDACQFIDKTDGDTIKELLEAGANPRIETTDGDMPLHKLARNGEHGLIKKIYEAVVKMADKDAAKADVNSQNKKGAPPIFCAVEGRADKINAVKEDAAKLSEYWERQGRTAVLLLNCGADLYVENEAGWNALHAAAHGGGLEAAKEIVAYMEKMNYTSHQMRRFINHVDTMGRTPLHIAAMRADPNQDKPELVNFLLKKGADPSLMDKAKMSAAQLADKSGRRKSKEFIEASELEGLQHKERYRRKSKSRDLDDAPLQVLPAPSPAAQPA